MNILKLLLLAALSVISFNNCFNNSAKSTADIEGLWVTNEETSSHFTSGTQKVVLQIKRDSNNKLSSRGVFMWRGEYQSEWKLGDVHYDSCAHRITIVDSDSDTLICTVDARNDRLNGAVHLQNNSRNPLCFIRADATLEYRLFYPRMPDSDGFITYNYITPEQIDDGLYTESIYNKNIDTSAIIRLINEIIDQKYGRMASLLLLKDNKLLVEEYFYGYDRTSLHTIRSCTKSVTSLLLGIALDHHKDIHIEQPIFSFFPEYNSLQSEGREEITLKNVLTMTAGLKWEEYPAEMFNEDDCFQYILSRPMTSKPGEKFKYNSGCSVLLGGVIQFLESQKTLAFAEQFLFTPMGITDYIWESHNNDKLRCGEGLSLRPRDMAKIGLLVLNEGKWRDTQLVSKEWIHESTKAHVKESEFFEYGYHWWHRSRNNRKWWKESTSTSSKEHDLIVAMGHGGQYIMIIKDLNMVIVTTASDYVNDYIARSKIPMVIEEIVPIFM